MNASGAIFVSLDAGGVILLVGASSALCVFGGWGAGSGARYRLASPPYLRDPYPSHHVDVREADEGASFRAASPDDRCHA